MDNMQDMQGKMIKREILKDLIEHLSQKEISLLEGHLSAFESTKTGRL